MKFSISFLLTCLSALTSAAAAAASATESAENHAIAHGIFNSILNNREFGSTFVKFSEWEAPNGDLYLVPSTSSKNENIAALGLGYKFVNNDNTIVQSANLNNVVGIKEENIIAQGFPFGWKKHDEPTADDFFPFGSKKFMMIGVNKNSFDTEKETSWDADLMEQAKGYDGLVDSSGLLNWFGEEEDDCNADKKTNKLFDTDHFLFVGVGSVDIEKPLDSYQDGMILKREIPQEPQYTVITLFTTTTVTSTHPVTVTHTVPAIENKEKAFPPEKTFTNEPIESAIVTPTHEPVESAIVTPTHEPFIFHTTTLEEKEKEDEWKDVPTSSLSPPDIITSSTITSIPQQEEPIPSTEGGDHTLTSDIISTNIENSGTEVTTTWSVPETWNSYPFTSLENNIGTYSTPATYLNDTMTEEIETITTSISSNKQFQTSLYYGNTTTTAVYNNSTSSAPEGSIFTRTKGSSSNGTGISTSLNAANGRNYWGSAFALVFAVISGAILI